MTSYTLSPVWGAGAQLFDNSGNVLTGGKIYTYEAGTTTPAVTYTDPIGNFFNSNPIIADASGRLSNEIWLPVSQAYKFVLKDTNDVLIATYDNIPTIPQPLIANDASSISYEQGYTVTAGAFTVGATYLITSVGTTNFVAIGAASNATGILFTATGVGSGTGTAEYSRTVETKLQEVVSILDFGADPTGATDSTTAIQNAVNSGAASVHFPNGSYVISTPIELPSAIHVYGDSSGNFTSLKTTITNSQVGGGIFWMVTNTSSAEITAPNISNFNLVADFPIKLNDPTVRIGLTSSPEPYYVFPKINNLVLNARVAGTGTGISFSKIFDFQILGCAIYSFEIGILLQGCDLGWVQNNRIAFSTAYQILEISTETFGSQTEIRNNDILASGPNCIHIKSCSRHARIYDNYIEAPATAAKGAIDLTNIDCPQYGPNTPANAFSIVCRDNRIDGFSFFSDFVYRLDGNTPCKNTVLHDAGSTGDLTGSKPLVINGTYLPTIYNPVHYATYDIYIPQGGAYQNFVTGQLPALNNGLVITPTSLSTTVGLQAQSAGVYTKYNGAQSFVITTGMTTPNSPLYFYLPAYGTNLSPLEVGETYEIYITAMSPSSETIRVGDFNGGSAVAVPLTTYFKTIYVKDYVAPAANAYSGAYIIRDTTTANIFVQNISFVKV
jgi:hypothetical protein